MCKCSCFYHLLCINVAGVNVIDINVAGLNVTGLGIVNILCIIVYVSVNLSTQAIRKLSENCRQFLDKLNLMSFLTNWLMEKQTIFKIVRPI